MEAGSSLAFLHHQQLEVPRFESFAAFGAFLARLRGYDDKDAVRFPGLERCVAMWEKVEGSGHFLQTLLPYITSLLSRSLEWRIGNIGDDELRELRLTRGQLLWLSANAFFLNIKKHREAAGHFDWAQVYQERWGDSVADARLMCWLSFFEAVRNAEEWWLQRPPLVAVRVGSVGADTADDWFRGDEVLRANEIVRFHDGKMEEVDGAFVDFANAQMHIGRIIASATQEEVLFSACPELFALLPFVDRLQDGEAVVVRGATRVCDYTGYADTFRFAKRFSAPFREDEVVVIDAVQNRHFPRSRRDIHKAFVAFAACEKEAMSTGAWGCGVFGGNLAHKLLQQAMAAQLAGKRIFFSCYHRHEERVRLQALLDECDRAKPTFAWLLTNMEQNQAVRDYLGHVLQELKKL